jgi:hypothetical protein
MQPALGATVGSSLVGCGVARAGAHRCDEGQPCGTAAYLYEERYLMHTFDHFCSVERRPMGQADFARSTSDERSIPGVLPLQKQHDGALRMPLVLTLTPKHGKGALSATAALVFPTLGKKTVPLWCLAVADYVHSESFHVPRIAFRMSKSSSAGSNSIFDLLLLKIAF